MQDLSYDAYVNFLGNGTSEYMIDGTKHLYFFSKPFTVLYKSDGLWALLHEKHNHFLFTESLIIMGI